MRFTCVHLMLSSAALTALLIAGPSAAQKAPEEASAHDMKLMSSDDLQARSAYQPTIARQGDRYIAYIGHHGGTEKVPKPINPMTGQAEFNGTSIIDVTDPSKPKYLKHLPGDEGLAEAGGAQMVRICAGKDLPKADKSAYYMLRTFGNQAHEIWNVTDPANPVLLQTLGGLRGTHKNFWECDTGVAYLISGVEGWRTKRMTQIYDLSDPAKPVKIRDFGLPGQQPGSDGAVPTDLHGPIVKGNRVYLGYGTSKGGIIQIVDREKLLNGPKEPTPENLLYPEISRLYMNPLVGAHTTFPMLGVPIANYAKHSVGATRDFLMVVNESTSNECQEGKQHVFFADITDETKPMFVSNYDVKESEGDYCSKGGRFGAHSSNESMDGVYYNKIAVIAYFNAGIRVLDVRDPFEPKEIAHYIPPVTDKTEERCRKIGDQNVCKTAIQTNNVETDDRGYIYAVDRANTGMSILELTGDAKKLY
jgi:hypothetical protein